MKNAKKGKKEKKRKTCSICDGNKGKSEAEKALAWGEDCGTSKEDVDEAAKLLRMAMDEQDPDYPPRPLNMCYPCGKEFLEMRFTMKKSLKRFGEVCQKYLKIRMELQKEELQVLDAIYGSDSKFTQISETHFQYKYGDDGEDGTFVLDIIWPGHYPGGIPEFTLDVFYNNFMSAPLKSYLLNAIRTEAIKNEGGVCTYTMIEWVRENREALFTAAKMEKLSLEPKKSDRSVDKEEKDEANEGAAGPSSSGGQKKEQLTKSQKRKEWDRKEGKGDEEGRGRDWVDVVKHLSQTGKQDDAS